MKKAIIFTAVPAAVLIASALYLFLGRQAPTGNSEDRRAMTFSMDRERLSANLRDHVEHFCLEIGSRSIFEPASLDRAAEYIEARLGEAGLSLSRQEYEVGDHRYRNILGHIGPEGAAREYVIGAHYDTVDGTMGADDNASAVAVLLETARAAPGLGIDRGDTAWTFAAFTLEEPPSFAGDTMGSRQFVREARRSGKEYSGAIIMEMVGYYDDRENSQSFPFPLQFLGYPKTGNFIGLVGNGASGELLDDVERSFRRNDSLPVETLKVPGKGGILPTIRFSDHASFWDAGYQAIMVTDTAFYRNPFYHTARDRPETLDYVRMAALVESLLIFMADASEDKSPP
jgi:hypothetical protein